MSATTNAITPQAMPKGTPRPIEHDAWADLGDEELRHYARHYQRRLALLPEECPPELLDDTRAFLAHLLLDAARELDRRCVAAARGVPVVGDRFPAPWLADLKRRVRLDALCAYHLGARLGPERGGKRQGPCPICRAGTNCFTVYLRDEADQHYYCFCCGAGGDAFNAVRQAFGCSFREAVEQLAREGDVPLPTVARVRGRR